MKSNTREDSQNISEGSLRSDEQTEASHKKGDYGALLIATFSLISMVTIFVFHEIARECSLQLYSLFADKLESQIWAWALECRMTLFSALLVGVTCGMVAFVATYCLAVHGANATYIRRYERKDYAAKRRKNIAIGCSTICVFFGIFVVGSLISDPHLFHRASDMLYSLVLSGITGISIVLYNGNRMRNVRRRDFYDDKTLQMEEFRFDHDTSKETFHLSLLAFVTLLVSIFFVLVFHFFQELPMEVLYSEPFLANASKNAGYAIVITVGFFAGILLQELQNLVDIRHMIREYHDHLQQRLSKQRK